MTAKEYHLRHTDSDSHWKEFGEEEDLYGKYYDQDIDIFSPEECPECNPE